MARPNAELFIRAGEIIAAWKNPLLISHAKPDGDALGSLIAMRSLLRSRGVDGTAVLFDAIPGRYALFNRYEAMPVLGHNLSEDQLANADGVILLDTCAVSQLAPIAEWLRSSTVPKLAVDHHVTRDELVDEYLIDESAAATCLIIHEWAGAMNWPLPSDAAEALFVGIAMDTGWFIHSNTDERALRAGADLVRQGVRPYELHQQLFQKDSFGRVRLLGAALNTLELSANERLAVITLPNSAFADCGATAADTEDIINEPLRIDSVVVSVLLVETGDDLIRVSFRSKPPPARSVSTVDASGSDPSPGECQGMDIDVSAVARAFGGGGHTRAAGARIPGSLPRVRQSVVTHLQSLLGRT